ncbi:MAG TPA: copper resistance CopC family protein, partial [Candidatus Limnocylindrales bacterium]
RTTPLLRLLAAFALLLALASPVAAHAELVRAIPADGETVTEPITVVSGRYSEDLISGSRLEITDGSGARVASGGIDPEDARRMVARPESPLTDGTYTVQSTARSADGHVERATWTFTVAVPASPSPTPEPTPTPSDASPSPSATASPSESPSATPTASPAPTDPASGSGDVLLPIIAALAIVAIGAGFLLNRSRTRAR